MGDTPSMSVTHRRSRTKNRRWILTQLEWVRHENMRTDEHREGTDDDHRWSMQVETALATLIDVGHQVLSGQPDPREWRKARKQLGLFP